MTHFQSINVLLEVFTFAKVTSHLTCRVLACLYMALQDTHKYLYTKVHKLGVYGHPHCTEIHTKVLFPTYKNIDALVPHRSATCIDHFI